MKEEYELAVKNIRTYILRLKYAFFSLDKKVKKTKNTRTDFDMSTATSALGGTILSSATSTDAQNAGKIVPSVGVALIPVKETVAPPLTAEQNQASLIRSSIKRLEYTIRDNALVGEKDMEIVKKIASLKNELKQTQVQLIDVQTEETSSMTEEQLNAYFDNPKVNKKYRMKKR